MCDHLFEIRRREKNDFWLSEEIVGAIVAMKMQLCHFCKKRHGINMTKTNVFVFNLNITQHINSYKPTLVAQLFLILNIFVKVLQRRKEEGNKRYQWCDLINNFEKIHINVLHEGYIKTCCDPCYCRLFHRSLYGFILFTLPHFTCFSFFSQYVIIVFFLFNPWYNFFWNWFFLEQMYKSLTLQITTLFTSFTKKAHWRKTNATQLLLWSTLRENRQRCSTCQRFKNRVRNGSLK